MKSEFERMREQQIRDAQKSLGCAGCKFLEDRCTYPFKLTLDEKGKCEQRQPRFMDKEIAGLRAQSAALNKCVNRRIG